MLFMKHAELSSGCERAWPCRVDAAWVFVQTKIASFCLCAHAVQVGCEMGCGLGPPSAFCSLVLGDIAKLILRHSPWSGRERESGVGRERSARGRGEGERQACFCHVAI